MTKLSFSTLLNKVLSIEAFCGCEFFDFLHYCRIVLVIRVIWSMAIKRVLGNPVYRWCHPGFEEALQIVKMYG